MCGARATGEGGAWSALLGTRALAFLRVLRRGGWVGQVLRPRGSEGCGVRGAGRLGRSPGLGVGRGGKVGGQDGVQSPNPSEAFGMWGFEGQPGLEAGCPEAPWPALPTRLPPQAEKQEARRRLGSPGHQPFSAWGVVKSVTGGFPLPSLARGGAGAVRPCPLLPAQTPATTIRPTGPGGGLHGGALPCASLGPVSWEGLVPTECLWTGPPVTQSAGRSGREGAGASVSRAGGGHRCDWALGQARGWRECVCGRQSAQRWTQEGSIREPGFRVCP